MTRPYLDPYKWGGLSRDLGQHDKLISARYGPGTRLYFTSELSHTASYHRSPKWVHCASSGCRGLSGDIDELLGICEVV